MEDVTLNLVVLRSANLDRAERFYELLGIKFAREQHGSGPEHSACVLGPVVLEIYPHQEGSEEPLVRVGFVVPSVMRAVRAVEDHGGVVVSSAKETRWGLRAVVADPDGHRVELIERQT